MSKFHRKIKLKNGLNTNLWKFSTFWWGKHPPPQERVCNRKHVSLNKDQTCNYSDKYKSLLKRTSATVNDINVNTVQNANNAALPLFGYLKDKCRHTLLVELFCAETNEAHFHMLYIRFRIVKDKNQDAPLNQSVFLLVVFFKYKYDRALFCFFVYCIPISVYSIHGLFKMFFSPGKCQHILVLI